MGMWSEALHPRSHGKFAHVAGSPGAAAERRWSRGRLRTPAARSPLSAGLTEEHWLTAHEGHARPKESLDAFKKRVTAAALSKGMTRDSRGFFYKREDVHQRTPLSPTGSPLAVGPTRIQRHKTQRAGAGRAAEQTEAGMSKRHQKARRSRTAGLEQAGHRTVGTDTGHRRVVQNRTARQVMSTGRHRA